MRAHYVTKSQQHNIWNKINKQKLLPNSNAKNNKSQSDCSSQNQLKSTTIKIQNNEANFKRIKTTYACPKFSIARDLQGMVQRIKKTKLPGEILISNFKMNRSQNQKMTDGRESRGVNRLRTVDQNKNIFGFRGEMGI